MARRPSSNSSRDVHSRDASISDRSEAAARIFGIIFILVGLFLIIWLVGSFIASKLPYRTDPNLPIPTLDQPKEYTNEDSTIISGTVLPGETVVLYEDSKRTDLKVETDENGAFTFEDVPLDDEGTFDFDAAVIRGGLLKRRSEFSNTVSVTADFTAPSSTISFDYQPDSTADKATIKGAAEAGAIVVLEGPSQSYEAVVDESGNFIFTDIPLTAGENTFTVKIKDLAGNEVVATKKVVIAYAGGDLNGDGATTGPNGELPESAGELDAALAFMKGNSLMMILGLAALGGFGLSSGAVYLHSKKRGN